MVKSAKKVNRGKRKKMTPSKHQRERCGDNNKGRIYVVDGKRYCVGETILRKKRKPSTKKKPRNAKKTKMPKRK
jgi:hypothetical protein